MDEDRPRDNDNNYNLPTPADEVKKCEDFLQNFVDSNGEAPYHTQLQDIANRERKLLEIYVDDLTYFKEDSEFVENVTRNAKRYLRWFEGAAERLLPPNTNNHLQQDVFDILYDQRRSALQVSLSFRGVIEGGYCSILVVSCALDSSVVLLSRPSITSHNITTLAHDQYTDIYPLFKHTYFYNTCRHMRRLKGMVKCQRWIFPSI